MEREYMLLDIILINKYIQFTIPEEFLYDWINTFYPMLHFSTSDKTEDIIKKITPYWDKICLSYSENYLPESFERQYGKLDRKIQIYPHFDHI